MPSSHDRASIEAALESDPDHPLSQEVAGRAQSLLQAFAAEITRGGKVPEYINLVRPRTALDEIAVEMFVLALEDSMGANDVPPIAFSDAVN